MRAVVVFFSGYLGNLAALIYLFHHLSPTPSIANIAVCVAVAFTIGGLASFWHWAAHHTKTLVFASFLSGLTVLFPFVVITYGYALVALPYVVLWSVAVLGGVWTIKKWGVSGG
ncbi:hypothetical protein [Massilia horti]|uniref:Uncharacterized protein n=1 Tax=Massilia horti TaxID=2562153 RepID=A0A4Y9T2Z4_9BURK|nr:hypothetical protein [Massilia horti]TFW34279.1 hypothetical protein E4O92_04355 [Massilia horti]